MDISKLRFAKQLFINGRFVDSIKRHTLEVINPNDESVLATVQKAGSQDVDSAVHAARTAFDKGPWPRMDAVDRAGCLFRLANLIEKNLEELAAIESINVGKPIFYAKVVDTSFTAMVYRYYAGWVDKIRGHTLPIEGNFNLYTRKEPVGVVGQIVPWNFPMVMQSWKMAPALAAGCTVVMKSAEQTPLSALKIAELVKEAGFPDGVVNIISGQGDTGAYLVRHPGIDKVAFTGSNEVGYDIMRNCHEKNLKRVTLQLGGKSPVIVTKNANLDKALDQASTALFFNAGQACNAGSRTYVHSSIYDQFVEEAGKRANLIKLGHSFAKETDQGPLISKQQMDKVLDYIDYGKKNATLVAGGTRGSDKGWFVRPTVFANVKDDHRIANEEIFGPVQSILKFDDTDEVIHRANKSNYGLAAGVVTDSLKEAKYYSKNLRAGTVFVNCHHKISTTSPFGGFKDSGIGRELGEEGLNLYLESKTVIENLD